MKKRIKKSKFFEDKAKLYYIFAACIFVFALGILFYFWKTQFVPSKNVDDEIIIATSTSEIVGCKYTNGLDGTCVNTEGEKIPKLIGVMIENFVDARPQAGIADARMVYEAPAEGNITRFLALFDASQEVKQAGPVRSARPYYLDWISEYPGAMYMHVGGSPEALEKLNAYKTFDVNEFYRGVYFWRDENISAPHNVFTSSELWNNAFDRFGDKNIVRNFDSWNFSSATTSCEQNCVNALSIPFLRPSYVVNWKYNAENKNYERFHGIVPHMDKNGNFVRANTVVIQYVTDKILDDVGRRALGTIGTGKAEVYVFGRQMLGTWKKENRTARTKFFDTDGTEVAFSAGKIWIEVVPLSIEISH